MKQPYALVLFGFASLLAATAAHAGGAAAFVNDVPVPIPGEILENQSITLNGEAGAGQSGNWALCSVRVDKNGAPIARQVDSTDALKADCRKIPFGTKAPAEMGLNLIVLDDGNLEVVNLAKEQNLVIQLAKISVPKVDGTYTFEVFADYNSPVMQDREAQWMWLTYDSTIVMPSPDDDYADAVVTFKEQCAARAVGPKYKSICAAWNSGKYANLKNTLMTFNKDGSWTQFIPYFRMDDITDMSTLYYDPSSASTHVYFDEAGKGIDGEFISVLPGTYGLKLCNAAGTCTAKLGVVAQ